MSVGTEMNVMIFLFAISSLVFVCAWLIFCDWRTMLISFLIGTNLFASIELGKMALQFCFDLNHASAYFFSTIMLAFLGWFMIRKHGLYDLPKPQPCIEHTPLRLDLAHDLTIQEK